MLRRTGKNPARLFCNGQVSKAVRKVAVWHITYRIQTYDNADKFKISKL